jgi:phosphotransferase system  glucose/maltose/N-acetylglucosamine-specific IIC component
MKSKFSQTMQDFSRAVIVPVKFMAVMGLFLAVSVILQLEFMPKEKGRSGIDLIDRLFILSSCK